jgi:EAL domain-containing protein (putative c-di-GMP-specific phosphodiesterase class I)
MQLKALYEAEIGDPLFVGIANQTKHSDAAGDQMANKLMEYRAAGMKVAIDDVGTGYSSMSYLHKFGIDDFKVDQSFVRGMFEHANYRTIIETISLMAHKLGLKVITEGVQTPEQREILIGIGCDFGQAHLFSSPPSASEMTHLLAE